MARKFKSRRTRRLREGDESADPQTVRAPSDTFTVIKENAAFKTYYESQGIMEPEELEAVFKSFQEPLCTTFRFTGSRHTAVDLRETMKSLYFPSLQDVKVDDVLVPLPQTIPWYPNELGWSTSYGRQILRKSNDLSMFHRFLVAETEVGNISRQEAVSMIPVLLLDIQPGHHVMDTCASPGSKTAQILEALHADGSQGLSSGLVVANDADTNRSYMLVKQAKRLQSPCLIVTNHEAQRFPSIHLTVEGQTEKKTLQFDRILADVPCSGDGTARKNLNLWKTWKALSGYGLHKMQLAILDRACELLKVGGRVVYSTCSLNPVENEAVVAAMLKLGNGTIELVDVSSHLPALKRRPGVSSWKYVNPKDGTVHTSMDTIPEETKRYGVDTFFPPEDSASLGLDRCLRVYPHLQDTGGFFVAVLQKVADYGRVDKHNSKLRVAEKDVTTSTEKISDGVSDNEENEPASPETKRPKLDKGGDDQENDAPTTSSVKSKTDKKAHQMAWNTNNESHDPFIFLGPDSEIVKEAQKLYGLKDGFPVDQFLVRTENENIRTIYFVSKDVKEILSAENSRKLKVVNTGIKVFSRHTGGVKEGGFQFRLNAEGVMTLAPHLSSNTVITTSYADLLVFLTNEYPKFECFSSEMQTKLTNSAEASYLLTFDPAKEQNYVGKINVTILIPMWRAPVSASILINKQERFSLMHRLTGTELCLEKGLDKTKAEADKKD